jgi:hypothetical protein
MHMRAITAWVVGIIALGTASAASAQPSGGTGTIFMGSYARRMLVVDEAAEKVTAEIPLSTGIPWSIRLSLDGSRFYIRSSDQEHVEIVDVATRKSLDSFTLSQGNKRVRIMAAAADPQNRIMTLLTRTTTKLSDRFEVGAATFVRYDLADRKVIGTVPWTADPEPGFFFELRYSPDGKLLYAFTDEVLIFDAVSLEQVGTWNMSPANEPGLGRFEAAWIDDTRDDAEHVNGVFAIEDKVQHRRQLVVARMNLGAKELDFFPLGPAPQQGRVSFALGPGRQRAYILVQEIGHHELWTIDVAGKRLLKKTTYSGRPRTAIQTSSNGRFIYLYEAGNTIDLYDAEEFKYLRTITLDADMTYDSFHVIGPRKPTARPTARQ